MWLGSLDRPRSNGWTQIDAVFPEVLPRMHNRTASQPPSSVPQESLHGDGPILLRGGAHPTLGTTSADGASTVDPGWSRDRDVKPEDIEATIYSALGINWTTVRYEDPFGRGFEYVPFASQDVYGPINELWT